MRLVWVALCLVCVGFAGTINASCSNEVPLAVRDTVLVVSAEDGTVGSGVVVAPNRVLTAAHAVRSGGQLQATVARQQVPAHAVSYDIQRDLALLAVNTADLPILELMARDLSPGESIWVAGHPRGGTRQFSFGQVVGPWRDALRVTAFVEQGQSGGALLACEDGLVYLGGTLSGYGALETEGQQQRLPDFSLAVPIAELRSFLRSAGVQFALSSYQ
ncbi:MAG: S1 family peptidase [Granulosicoccaceae bacterium]